VARATHKDKVLVHRPLCQPAPCPVHLLHLPAVACQVCEGMPAYATIRRMQRARLSSRRHGLVAIFLSFLGRRSLSFASSKTNMDASSAAHVSSFCR
jgi:hypothetical protein